LEFCKNGFQTAESRFCKMKIHQFTGIFDFANPLLTVQKRICKNSVYEKTADEQWI